MPTKANIEILGGRGATGASLTDGPEDISDGLEVNVQTETGDIAAATLYIATEGAVDVSIEFSPDNGDTWREPLYESPVTFDEADQDLVLIEYQATDLRVTGSNSTAVDLDLRVRA